MASCSASRVRAPARRRHVFSAGFRFFNGRKVWRISRQKEKLAASLLEEPFHLLACVSCQGIHQHDLSSDQTWCQNLFTISLKDDRGG